MKVKPNAMGEREAAEVLNFYYGRELRDREEGCIARMAALKLGIDALHERASLRRDAPQATSGVANSVSEGGEAHTLTVGQIAIMKAAESTARFVTVRPDDLREILAAHRPQPADISTTIAAMGASAYTQGDATRDAPPAAPAPVEALPAKWRAEAEDWSNCRPFNSRQQMKDCADELAALLPSLAAGVVTDEMVLAGARKMFGPGYDVLAKKTREHYAAQVRDILTAALATSRTQEKG